MEYGKAEMMCVALAREIKDGDVVFHGLASPVPMTAMKLAKALGTNFTYVTLSDGVDADWTRPAVIGSTLTSNTYEGGVATFGLDEIFDLAGTGRVDISFLSLVEIDKKGRINMSYIGGTYDQPKVRMPGGAGSATLTPITKRTTIWKTKQDTRSFVKEVTFTTAAADPTKEFTLVSDLGIFRMKDGELALDSIFPYTTLEEVKANTGWEITQTDVPVYPEPTEEELKLLEKVDPNRIRYVEF
jgi:glutaconate CoA-transferase subunit B